MDPLPLTTVEEVHALILRRACEIANQRWAQTGGKGREDRQGRDQLGQFSAPLPSRAYEPGERFNVAKRRARNPQNIAQGEVFRPDAVKSQKGGLAISVDPMVTHDMTKEEVRELHDLARVSMRRSVKENERLVAGIVVGEARKGRNYFNRFSGVS